MPTLLIVDDDPLVLKAIELCLAGEGIAVRSAMTAAEAIRDFSQNRPDCAISDVRLPDRSGLDLLAALRGIDAKVPIILMTGYGTAETAIEAMRRGAFDYLLKPIDPDALLELVLKAFAVARLMRVPPRMAPSDEPPGADDLFVGQAPGMQEVFKTIGRVAPTDATVLVLGEGGTGKELVARAIYHHSRRAEQPFLAINCAAIPETLLESELFGHEKGSFTGAERKRVGKFEQCHGGTIFLDEVAEMAPLTQAKMLRLIQEQQFERLGGTETVRTDVRLIAATNADLERMAEDGRFRKDLYFRLNVFTIKLPPLRERGDDVALLIEHYLKRFGRELGKPVAEVAPTAAASLRAYPWPGNVRELQSVLKQSVLRMSGSALLTDFLPEHVLTPASLAPGAGAVNGTAGAFDWDQFVGGRITGGSENLYAEALERMEREVLLRVLKHTDGNQLQAARILGITRGSLRNKIRTLGISIARSVWSDDDHSDG